MINLKKYKVIYFTNCENGFYNLQNMEKIVSISAIVTFNKKDKISNISGFTDVSKFGKEKEIKVIELDNNNKLDLDKFKSLDFNLIIVNGWSRLIPKDLILMSEFGAIGVHAGHPPIGHGRAPISWNIIYGFKDLEVYSFVLTENADDGDILEKQTIEISEYDNAKTIYEKVTYTADKIIKKTVKNFDNIVPLKQNLKFASFYKKRTPLDSHVNFNQKVHDVYNFIRSLSKPYPNAYAFIDKKKHYLIESAPFDRFLFRDYKKEPGKIIESFPSGLIVMTQDYPIMIKKIIISHKEIKFKWNQKKYIGKYFE